MEKTVSQVLSKWDSHYCRDEIFILKRCPRDLYRCPQHQSGKSSGNGLNTGTISQLQTLCSHNRPRLMRQFLTDSISNMTLYKISQKSQRREIGGKFGRHLSSREAPTKFQSNTSILPLLPLSRAFQSLRDLTIRHHMRYWISPLVFIFFPCNTCIQNGGGSQMHPPINVLSHHTNHTISSAGENVLIDEIIQRGKKDKLHNKIERFFLQWHPFQWAVST